MARGLLLESGLASCRQVADRVARGRAGAAGRSRAFRARATNGSAVPGPLDGADRPGKPSALSPMRARGRERASPRIDRGGPAGGGANRGGWIHWSGPEPPRPRAFSTGALHRGASRGQDRPGSPVPGRRRRAASLLSSLSSRDRRAFAARSVSRLREYRSLVVRTFEGPQRDASHDAVELRTQRVSPSRCNHSEFLGPTSPRRLPISTQALDPRTRLATGGWASRDDPRAFRMVRLARRVDR